MSASDRQQGLDDAARARAEVYETLGQLQHNLNFAARFDDAVDETRARIAEQREKNPAAFFAGVAGVAVAAGLVVWGIASAVQRRFG